ncbi:Uncharacterised protein [Mycobacteroides abscessus subsp. abscessus]|nr:Uncharacterised protein [Mycobacteroides abscessus subsp. abscessus]
MPSALERVPRRSITYSCSGRANTSRPRPGFGMNLSGSRLGLSLLKYAGGEPYSPIPANVIVSRRNVIASFLPLARLCRLTWFQ